MNVSYVLGKFAQTLGRTPAPRFRFGVGEITTMLPPGEQQPTPGSQRPTRQDCGDSDRPLLPPPFDGGSRPASPDEMRERPLPVTPPDCDPAWEAVGGPLDGTERAAERFRRQRRRLVVLLLCGAILLGTLYLLL